MRIKCINVYKVLRTVASTIQMFAVVFLQKTNMKPLDQPQGLKLESDFRLKSLLPLSQDVLLAPGPCLTSSCRLLIAHSICNAVSQKHSPLFQALFLDWAFSITRALLEVEVETCQQHLNRHQNRRPKDEQLSSFFSKSPCLAAGSQRQREKRLRALGVVMTLSHGLEHPSLTYISDLFFDVTSSAGPSRTNCVKQQHSPHPVNHSPPPYFIHLNSI